MGPVNANRIPFLNGMEVCVWDNLRQPIYPDNKALVEKAQDPSKRTSDEFSISRAQRRARLATLAERAEAFPDRCTAIVGAYATDGYRYKNMAEYFDIYLATAGGIVRSDRQHHES